MLDFLLEMRANDPEYTCVGRTPKTVTVALEAFTASTMPTNRSSNLGDLEDEQFQPNPRGLKGWFELKAALPAGTRVRVLWLARWVAAGTQTDVGGCRRRVRKQWHAPCTAHGAARPRIVDDRTQHHPLSAIIEKPSNERSNEGTLQGRSAQRRSTETPTDPVNGDSSAMSARIAGQSVRHRAQPCQWRRPRAWPRPDRASLHT